MGRIRFPFNSIEWIREVKGLTDDFNLEAFNSIEWIPRDKIRKAFHEIVTSFNSIEWIP